MAAEAESSHQRSGRAAVWQTAPRGGLTKRRQTWKRARSPRPGSAFPHARCRRCSPGGGSARGSLSGSGSVKRSALRDPLSAAAPELWAPSCTARRRDLLFLSLGFPSLTSAPALAPFHTHQGAAAPSPAEGRSAPLRSAPPPPPPLPAGGAAAVHCGGRSPAGGAPRGAAARADYSPQRAARRRAGRSL